MVSVRSPDSIAFGTDDARSADYQSLIDVVSLGEAGVSFRWDINRRGSDGARLDSH